MNKVILTLALSALMLSTAACSSKAKKQEDTTSAQIESSIQSLEKTEPTKDLSLGSSSSGRGH